MRGTALLNLGYEAWNAAEASTRDRLAVEAMDAVTRAIALRPWNGRPWIRARARSLNGDLAGALADCSAAIRLGLLNSTDLRQFRGSLREVAADTTPDGRQGFAGLALILAAVEDYDLAIPPDSTDGRALLSRASALASIGEHEMARDDYTRVLAVDPGSSAPPSVGPWRCSRSASSRNRYGLRPGCGGAPERGHHLSQRGRAHGQIAANTEDPSTIHTHATQAIADLKASSRSTGPNRGMAAPGRLADPPGGSRGGSRQAEPVYGRRSRPRSGPSPRRSS